MAVCFGRHLRDMQCSVLYVARKWPFLHRSRQRILGQTIQDKLKNIQARSIVLPRSRCA